MLRCLWHWRGQDQGWHQNKETPNTLDSFIMAWWWMVNHCSSSELNVSRSAVNIDNMLKNLQTNKLKSLKVAKWRRDEWRMMKDDDFNLLRGFADKRTDEQIDICDCRVAFATEKSILSWKLSKFSKYIGQGVPLPPSKKFFIADRMN